MQGKNQVSIPMYLCAKRLGIYKISELMEKRCWGGGRGGGGLFLREYVKLKVIA